MADLGQKLAEMWQSLFGSEAYARRTKTPIDIKTENNKWQEVTGLYNQGYDPGQTEHIEVTKPSQNLDVSPREVLDVIKHELVHQALRNVVLPGSYVNAGFHSALPYEHPKNYTEEQLDIYAPDPSRLYNWGSWGRAGDPIREIPAYMSIYNPQYMGSGPSQVTKVQRDQFMTDFMDYLNSNNQQKAAKMIQELVQGRESYQGGKLLPGSK